jgi:hypothetical protein
VNKELEDLNSGDEEIEKLEIGNFEEIKSPIKQ